MCVTAVPPHTTCLEPRAWRPTAPERGESEQRENAPTAAGAAQQLSRKTDSLAARVFSDDVMSDEDVRYWMLGAAESVLDLESAVLADRHNVQLWLRLAYRKLHSPKL